MIFVLKWKEKKEKVNIKLYHNFLSLNACDFNI